MIHPSYTDLMEVVNSEVEPGEQPVVNSRYSIVLATAKRARQIIAGGSPLVKAGAEKKPLSIAVEELYESKIKIMGEDEEDEDEMISESEEREPDEEMEVSEMEVSDAEVSDAEAIQDEETEE